MISRGDPVRLDHLLARRASVDRLARDDASNATARIGYIPPPPRDEVYVAMADGLSSYLPTVHSDVEALDGAVGVASLVLHLAQQETDGPSLRLEQLKIGWRVASRDDKRVQHSHRVAVTKCQGQRVLGDDFTLF